MTTWNHGHVAPAQGKQAPGRASDDTGPVHVDAPTPRAIPVTGTDADDGAGNTGDSAATTATTATAATAATENPTPATGGPAPVSPPRARAADNRNAAALFRVHMFPIGHLPVPSSRPNRQLPPPEPTAVAPADATNVWGVSRDVNSESISRWLDAMGVPPEVVSLGAEADGAWCLLRTAEPAATEADEAVVWDVFWQEQGDRYDWARFSSEQVACHYLFGRLTWAQVARGAVGVVG